MLKKLAMAALGVCMSAVAFSANAKDISGAGATFPAPVYAKWAEAYKAATGNSLNYQSIGSGGGIKQIKANTVDFGASDAPLKKEELDESGLMQFPMVMGGVVPVMNLPGIKAGQVKLTGSVLAEIFLGKIKKWNDPKITALNPGVNLPGLPITVVHRSDGSGTTFLFTNYLAKVSGSWAGTVGADKAVAWPVGLGGKGNEGVAAFVKQTIGSIGYVEFAYAKQNNSTYALLKNRSGAFVAPDDSAFRAAAAGADWAKAPGMYLLLLDQPGANSWPITGATFILMHTTQSKPENAKAALAFFDWSYKNGDDMAVKLDYVPMPETVKNMVRANWASQIKTASGGSIYTK